MEALAARHGVHEVVDCCAALLQGEPPETRPQIAVGLSAHGTSVEQLRSSGYGADHWWRTWGARGLLYVWAPSAAPAVVHGLADPEWRPAEMSLKVAALREIAEAVDAAVDLAGHERGRVRAAAVRALGLVGDTEHVPSVRTALEDDDAQVRRAAGLALERMVDRLDLPAGELP